MDQQIIRVSRVSGLLSCAALLAYAVLGASAAVAADITENNLPAVSSLNGKIEFQGGPFAVDGFDSRAEWKGGASLSIPLNERLGLQADIGAGNTINGNSVEGGIVHLFTRDPNSYLFGLAGGGFWTDNANAQLIGPELELYSGPVTFQAYGGYMNESIAGVKAGKFFGFADASYYATQNIALKIGVKDIADFRTAHAGLEWQISDATPVSVTLDGKLGDSNYRAVDLGLKIYLGSETKSLQRRHREDDPPNRIIDVFNGLGSSMSGPSVPVCGPGERLIHTTSGPVCVNIDD